MFEVFLLWRKNYGIGFCQVQQHDFIMTSNYVIVSIKLCLLEIRSTLFMSSFDINNHHHHHHKTSSITMTANFYYCYWACYCYCWCWCCWWWWWWWWWYSYKVRQVFLQSATACFITKCDCLLLQSATAFFSQSATSAITKGDRYYKVRWLLRSATEQPILGDTRHRMFVVKIYSKIETSS